MRGSRLLVVALLLAACDGGAVTHVSKLWAGDATTCAETMDGRLWCWGSDPSMQETSGFAHAILRPARAGGDLTNLDAVTIAGTLICAIEDGSLFCWGTGAADVGGSPYLPRLQSTVTDAVLQVSILGPVKCVLKTDGSAWCWGFGAQGTLGDGQVHDSQIPVAVASMSSGVSYILAGGGNGTFALKDDGSVWGWGAIAGANLLERWYMDPSALPYVTEPVPIVDGSLAPIAAVRQIRGTTYFTCGLDVQDRLLCWGNLPKSAGMERPQVDVATVVDLGGPPVPTTEISAGQDMMCRLRTDGGVDCMGVNDLGQLGDGTSTDRFAMAPVTGLRSPAMHIVSGSQHTCAILSDSTLWCWGSNRLGQLGVGDTTDRRVATQVVLH
jgi:alpha-tubulin suppressor-like RCC1 family protein